MLITTALVNALIFVDPEVSRKLSEDPKTDGIICVPTRPAKNNNLIKEGLEEGEHNNGLQGYTYYDFESSSKSYDRCHGPSSSVLRCRK